MTYKKVSLEVLRILLNTREKGEYMLRKFTETFDIPFTSAKVVRAKVVSIIEKKILPPINEKIRRKIEKEVKEKWQREGKNTNGTAFEGQVNIEIDRYKLEYKDKEYKHRSLEIQRANNAYDAFENGIFETDIPSGLKVDEDGNSPDNPENPNPDGPPSPLYTCFNCRQSGSDKSGYRKWKRDGKTYCLKCLEKVRNSGGKSPCPGGGKCAGGFCSEVSESSKWNKHPRSGKWYCQTCWNNMDHGDNPSPEDNDTPPPQNPLQAEIDRAIGEIQDALEEEPQVFIGELESQFQGYKCVFERFRFPQQIHSLKDQVLAAIRAKREQKKKKNEDTNDPLIGHKAFSIEAIEFYLSKRPEVRADELEEVNQNYLEEISLANDRDQIDAIVSRVLKNIQAVRENKIKGQNPDTLLANLRQEAINLIHQALNRKPSLSESDISHRSWEEDLKNASDESQIVQIRDSVLAELKSKRSTLKEEGRVVELISKGQSVNTFEELAEIIKQLKHYRSSDAYQSNQTEIEALENKLKGLNDSKYNGQVKTDLEQQIKNNGLTKEELKEDTQKAINKAEQTGELADKKVAEEKVARDGAQVGLGKMMKKARGCLNKSKLEKEQMAREIENTIKKDKFWWAAYQVNKPQIDQLLSQLRGEQQQSQSPDSPKPTWPKALGIGALILVPLGLVGSIILLKRKRRQGR